MFLCSVDFSFSNPGNKFLFLSMLLWRRWCLLGGGEGGIVMTACEWVLLVFAFGQKISGVLLLPFFAHLRDVIMV